MFKGGTALHKIHLEESLRFSEDIDLEHKDNKKLKFTLKAINQLFKKKNFNKKIRKKKNNYEISALYQSEITEESGNLKIEISPREDFSILGYTQKPLRINNVCFSSDIMVNTYNINEILSQKTRALYQRNKGRDLYDLYVSQSHPDFDIEKIAQCFIRHMREKKDGKTITAIPTEKEFITNLKKKEESDFFLRDTYRFLKTDVEYNQADAFEWAKKEFVPSLIKECIK
ncbi:MAG: nucleotidyl transferase AbiEii/AbiGii toxin family protein [Flavobacteriaceae bacterium]|nr:nucleotidyl transferase AbiEii/AbiGii toxin family protein [Flavobacteriaceae bacterium]